jgi:hypothetical protein
MSNGPIDPSPQQEPTHDVPVYPEQDPPPGTEPAIRTAGPGERERHNKEREGPDVPGDESQEDVDEDDLDPQVPHSPPDGKQAKIVFDENKVAG